ncbi:hypothetical protein [Paraburkholderia xenovorans]|uniref:hypothetical protein n=1 Tax=Paraburkholderia xenovorans TaxID=36873 RepID=UPI0038B6B69E
MKVKPKLIQHAHLPSVETASEHDWPIKHSRYISDWTENAVTINVGHKSAPPIYRTWNFDTVFLAIQDGTSPFRRTRRLSDFLEFSRSLKCVINACCGKYHQGDLNAYLPAVIATSLRIFIWMHRHSNPKLGGLTRTDAEELAQSVARDGWWKILEYDGALKKLLKLARNDPVVRKAIKGTSNGDKGEFINGVDAESIERLIGLPFAPGLTPKWFIDEYATIASLQSRGNAERVGNALKNVGRVMQALNLFANIPASFDKLSFFPFADANKRATELQKGQGDAETNDKDGRTRNLPLDAAVCVFGEAIRWVYDYFPGILATCMLVRKAFDDWKGSASTADREVKKTLLQGFPHIQQRYGLPFNIRSLSKGDDSLVACLKHFYTAVTCLVAINHGRRKNEVNGSDKPYGLYHGCVVAESEEFQLCRIDIYIEKSIRDFQTFWCNKMVVDCVRNLEALYACFRPLSSPDFVAPTDLTAARAMKLFTYRVMTLSGLNGRWQTYRWDTDSKAFFAKINLPEDILSNKTHPFRRLFCLLFVFRYDHPELLALSHHLGHFGLEQTKIYVSDPPMRQLENRLSMLMTQARTEEVALDTMLKEARSEYALKKIEDMLNGQDTGGAFPRLVLKLLKRLSSSVQFRLQTSREKASALNERLERHGYSPLEKPHCACFAGKARHTLRHSNCFHDGELHTEEASPKKCRGCIHQLTTDNYESGLRAEAESSMKRAQNVRLPPSQRRSAATFAQDIEQVINGYREMAQANQKALVAIINGWSTATEEYA